MKGYRQGRQRFVLAILTGLLAISPGATAQIATSATDQPPPPPSLPANKPPLPFDVPEPDRPLSGTIDFSGAPIQAVLDYYARLTNRSIIQAPTVTGTIVFRSQTELTVREAIQALDSVLAINGVAVVPLGDKFLKVVQIATGKQEGPPVLTEGGQLAGGDALVTQIIQLQYAEASEVGAALQPYVHAYGQLQPFTRSNSIFITDTAANIKRMLEIVEFLDNPSPLRMETKVYDIQNASAEEVAEKLKAVIQETEQLSGAGTTAGQPGVPRVLPRTTAQRGAQATAQSTADAEGQSIIEGKVIVTADARTNKLFVLSRPSNFEFFKVLIEELDAQVEPEFITNVIELNYANSEDLAALLNSLITGSALPAVASRAAGEGERPPAAPARALSAVAEAVAVGMFELADRLRVLPDPRTNSLLVMATHGDMQRVQDVIRALDQAVAQVLIEVVIAEVTLTGSLDVGVDWFKRELDKGSWYTQGGTDNFENLSPQNLTTEAGAAAATLASGGLTYYFTLKNLRLDSVLRLAASSSKFKVLSTPVLQTMHNQEADIIVGESRPVLTQTVSDLGTIGTDNFRSNVEYRDVAIELKVTPRINPDGYVTMEVEQKINDIAGVSRDEINLTPTITKREARSVVVVRDNGTVVLGGLIREDKSVGETKVPVLGDIPFFGTLFKSKANTKNRTELIVFIRPTVLRTDAETNQEARERAEMLKAGDELQLDKIFDGETAHTDDEFTIEELERERKEEAEEKE